jgi:hypothetical protein
VLTASQTLISDLSLMEKESYRKKEPYVDIKCDYEYDVSFFF